MHIAWKRFDGERTRIESLISRDRGEHFVPGPTLETPGDSDQPRLVSRTNDVLLVWRRADTVAVERLFDAPKPVLSQGAAERKPNTAGDGSLQPFVRGTLAQIERRMAGKPFWLVLWDLECAYCMKSLANLAQAQRAQPDLRVVTITTDPLEAAAQINERLAQLGVRSQAYAFGNAPDEALRFAIDPAWHGEKPRAYQYDASGARTPVTGVIAPDRFASR